MRTASYNCPCCGGPLAFDGATGKLECAACGNAFEPEALEMLNVSESGEQISFERPKEGFQEAEEGVQAYVCENCGAELMTENTTTAIECPYCGSPTILPDRIEGGVKPEKVIPFTVTQEQARHQFEEYFKGKWLLPNVFLTAETASRKCAVCTFPTGFSAVTRAPTWFMTRKRCTRAKGRVGNHPHEALSCAPSRRHAL